MASWYQSGLENTGQPVWSTPDSKHKRMELNSTLVCFQREQNLRAMQLQSRWREVREREHRAWVRNRQLLQDFQKAQETLKDLAARTAAMGTIRVEYEKQLEQKFSRWQQRLNEKRLQHKEAELHVKDFLRRREENRRDTDSGLPGLAHSHSPAGPSYLTNTPLTLHTDPLKKSRDLKNTTAAFHKEDYTNSTPDLVWNSMFHPSWLTQVEPQTSASQAQTLHNLKASVSMEDRSFQEHSRAGYPFQLPLPSPAIQPFDPRWLLPPIEPLSSWYGLYTGFPARPQFTSLQVPWPGFPSLDPRAWGTSKVQEQEAKEGIPTSSRRWEWEGRDGGAHPLEGSRCLRKERSSDQSSELDVRPVRLSSTPGVSSGRSSACSGAPSENCSRVPRKRKDKRGRISESHTVRKEISCKGSLSGCRCAEATVSRVGGLCVHRMERSLETRLHQRSSSSSECVYKMATVPPDQEQEEGEEVILSQEEPVEASAGLDKEAGDQESTGDEEEIQHSSQEEEDEEGGEGVKEEECKELVEEERQEGEKEGKWDGNKGETGDETEIARREENEDDEVEVTEEEVGIGEGEESSGSGNSEDGESDGIPEQGECMEQEETPDEEVGEKLPNSEQEGAQEKGDGAKVELEGDEDDEAQGSGHFEECNEEEGDTEGERKSMITLSESSDDDDGEEGSGTMKESAKEQEEMEDDISKEEEEADEEETTEEEAEDSDKKDREGSGKAEDSAASNSSDKESEEESDSDDEIISSQLEYRKIEATNEGWNLEGWKTKAKENMTKIEEEEEGEEDGEEHRMNNKKVKYDRASFRNVMTNDEEGEWADVEEDIEGLLAPRRSSPKPHVPDIVDEKATGRAPALKEEPSSHPACSAPREKKKISVKPKALWHDSESDSVEEMLAGEKPAAPSMDDQDDFDGFYD